MQIRSLDDHSVLPGITIGDIGVKFGNGAYNTMDNGVMHFDHIRIPRNQLLMRLFLFSVLSCLFYLFIFGHLFLTVILFLFMFFLYIVHVYLLGIGMGIIFLVMFSLLDFSCLRDEPCRISFLFFNFTKNLKTKKIQK